MVDLLILEKELKIPYQALWLQQYLGNLRI